LDEREAQSFTHQCAGWDRTQAAAVPWGVRKTPLPHPRPGFYEWQQRENGKQPYRFRRKDLEPFAFAGIWEFNRLGGQEVLSAAIIVGEPNPLVGGVHDRMPVMVLMEDYDQWLGADSDLDELRAMLRPYDADLMEAYAVSRAVNSVKNDTEECIEPVNEAVSTAK
jgi:putative SOS response-associated peptidase YedK